MEKIDAIILAGGEGKRLRNLVYEIPKSLAIVSGKPFLDILLAQLNKCNRIKRVILAVGYMGDKIIEKYKDCSLYNFDIIFSVEDKLLGTGGAIKKAIRYTKTKDILVLNGDSYTEFNIEDLIKTHRDKKRGLTIVLYKVEDVSQYGSVIVDDQNRIILFEEKKEKTEPGLINAGIYMMRRDIFSTIKKNRFISFEKELLPAFIKNIKGNIYGYIVDQKFIDIGIPERYKKAEQYLK